MEGHNHFVKLRENELRCYLQVGSDVERGSVFMLETGRQNQGYLIMLN